MTRSTGRPRVLVLLPQLPHDPASGASRTLTTIAELLAEGGFAVHVLATTATDQGVANLDAWQAARGATAQSDRQFGFDTLRLTSRAVTYVLLETGSAGVSEWAPSHGAAYDRLTDHLLKTCRPDIVLTYGGTQFDVDRQRRARAAGARVVFGLFNTRYLRKGFFDHLDGVITPSHFLSSLYFNRIGLRAALATLCRGRRRQFARADLAASDQSGAKGLVFF